MLVAREEPDGDRDEANRDERDNDVLGQRQNLTSWSRLWTPDLPLDASTGSCLSKPA